MRSGTVHWLAVSVIIIILIGSTLTLWTAEQADQNMRDQLLIKRSLDLITYALCIQEYFSVLKKRPNQGLT